MVHICSHAGGRTGSTTSRDPEIEAQNEMVKMGLSHFPKPSEAQVQGTGAGGSAAEARLPVPPCAMSGGLGEIDQREFQDPKHQRILEVYGGILYITIW